MSRDALLAALQRDAEQLLSELQAQGASREAELRRETDARRQQQHTAETTRCQTLAAAERQALLTRSRRQALLLRLAGEERLQRRLFALAQSLLGELAAQNPALLAALAAELPQTDWQQVTVHPRDLESAQRLFPQARIESDAAISGGFRASAAAGRILVDTTLEKRLARGWPELLPRLLHDLEVSRAAPPD